MLKIKCPTCGRLLQGDDALRGTVQYCPQCRHFIEIDANTLPVQLYDGRLGPIPLRPARVPQVVAPPTLPPYQPSSPTSERDHDLDSEAFAWIEELPRESEGDISDADLEFLIESEMEDGNWEIAFALQEKLAARQRARPPSVRAILLWGIPFVVGLLPMFACHHYWDHGPPGPLKSLAADCSVLFVIIYALAIGRLIVVNYPG